MDAVGSDGTTSSSTTSVEAATEWPNQEGSCLFLRPNGNNQTSLMITPNPSSQLEQNIKIETPNDGTFSMALVDLNGKLVQNIFKDKDLLKGTHFFKIKTQNTGVFLVRLVNEKGISTVKKILKF